MSLVGNLFEIDIVFRTPIFIAANLFFFISFLFLKYQGGCSPSKKSFRAVAHCVKKYFSANLNSISVNGCVFMTFFMAKKNVKHVSCSSERVPLIMWSIVVMILSLQCCFVYCLLRFSELDDLSER